MTKIAFLNMCYFCGLMIGGISFGLASDRYGRRTALIFSILASSLTSLMGAALTTYWSYLLMRFLCGMATEGMLMSAFIIAIESVGSGHSARAGILLQVRL